MVGVTAHRGRGDGAGDVFVFSELAKAMNQFAVLLNFQSFVESAAVDEVLFPADDDARTAPMKGRTVRQILEEVDSVILEAIDIRTAFESACSGLATELLSDNPEGGTFENRVGIKEHQQFAFCHSGSQVSSHAQTFAREDNEPIAHSAGDICRVVGAAVRNDNCFKPAVILLFKLFERCAEISLLIMGRDDNGDHSRGSHVNRCGNFFGWQEDFLRFYRNWERLLSQQTSRLHITDNLTVRTVAGYWEQTP